MADWNKKNIVEINHFDKYGIKNKIRNLEFDHPNDLKNLLIAYNIINTQHTKGLTIQNSLKSTIQLLDHQIMAAKIVKNDLNGRVILADEVGLGKTIEAGILLKEYFVTGMIKNALILTPPSLRSQWRQELKSKFDLDFITNEDDDRFEDFDKHSMLISSLSKASTDMHSKKLNSIEWDVVVVDEAHRLRNANTKAHQFIRNLSSKFIFLLSATPIQNSIEDLYNLVEIIRPGILGSWNSFAATYTTDKKARVVNPNKRIELQQILRQAMVRTTREEVKSYINLTERIPKTYLLDPTPEETELYDRSTDFVRSLWSQEKSTKHFILPLMILQRQISSSSASVRTALSKKINQHPSSKKELEELIVLTDKIKKDTKIIKLEEIIKENPDSKYLIFTEFIDTQDYICDTLENNKIQTVKFNGSMTTDARDTAVSKFKREIQILVSTEAGGEGQNFQFCSNVVNYDLPWNPMRIEQRVGRIHRIGQTEDVKIHNLAMVGSIEEHVLKLLFDKINLFQMTIGDLDLLFEDGGFDKMPAEIFESFMSSKNRIDTVNKFSALGSKWVHEKEDLNDVIMDFDDKVFANFNLSVLEKKK